MRYYVQARGYSHCWLNSYATKAEARQAMRRMTADDIAGSYHKLVKVRHSVDNYEIKISSRQGQCYSEYWINKI